MLRFTTKVQKSAGGGAYVTIDDATRDALGGALMRQSRIVKALAMLRAGMKTPD